ncbi:thioredoxin fold domain-containing protein [Ramlibacter sp. USB13]|uniref:Thioredoxin fold domain-containing protein n=1 Tax=Ramlibacter cellulosilyticus TaxID=2764187 RepID=A0A923MP96_9BURK|nr:thioredoxin fold domain-containing protein [Ramlibacter cellulosilyticus]MBC5782376.1 thioredoxin fold domain-containing protein [Ramlibacter cellulosilyticus]
MKRRACLAAASATVFLAACGKQEASAPGAAPAASVPVSLEKIASDAKGFSVGSTMSTRVVYVFFDAQCPHCAVLWEAAKPLKSQARFVWIPVGLLGDKSIAQGAAILASSDPVATMEQNEASVQAKSGGISAMNVDDAQKEVVRRNTQLLTAFGFGGVPTVVGKHATTGELVTIDGAVPTGPLAQRLGLNAPAS